MNEPIELWLNYVPDFVLIFPENHAEISFVAHLRNFIEEIVVREFGRQQEQSHANRTFQIVLDGCADAVGVWFD